MISDLLTKKFNTRIILISIFVLMAGIFILPDIAYSALITSAGDAPAADAEQGGTVAVLNLYIQGDTGPGGDSITSISVYNNETADSLSMTSILIYRDQNGNNIYDFGIDTFEDTLLFNASYWENLSLEIPVPNTGDTFLFVANIHEAAVVGDSIQIVVDTEAINFISGDSA